MKLPHILLVEDERLVADLIAVNLESQGYRVSAAATLGHAAQLLGEHSIDLVVLDLMLPDGDGVFWIEKLRSQKIRLPILILTARNEIETKVRGLRQGADDYLTKPFDILELQARIEVLLRRQEVALPSVTTDAVLTHSEDCVFFAGGLFANLQSGSAKTNEGTLFLTATELKLLNFLIHNANQPLSRADILDEVWGMDKFPTERTVDNFIVRLRKLFEPNPQEPIYFLTLRARGYLFKSPA